MEAHNYTQCRYNYRGRCLYRVLKWWDPLWYCPEAFDVHPTASPLTKPCPKFEKAPSRKTKEVTLRTHILNVRNVIVGGKSLTLSPKYIDTNLTRLDFILTTRSPLLELKGEIRIPHFQYVDCIYRLTQTGLSDLLSVSTPEVSTKAIRDTAMNSSIKAKFPFTFKTRFGKVLVLDEASCVCNFVTSVTSFFKGFLDGNFSGVEVLGEDSLTLKPILDSLNSGCPVTLRSLTGELAGEAYQQSYAAMSGKLATASTVLIKLVEHPLRLGEGLRFLYKLSWDVGAWTMLHGYFYTKFGWV